MASKPTVIELLDQITDVDFGAWRRQGIRLVCLDVDSTLTSFNGSFIKPRVVNAIKLAAKNGMRFVLLTNNILGWRLRAMQETLGGTSVIEAIYNPKYLFDRKPGTIMLRRLQKNLQLKPSQIGIVGDTYASDVQTALRMSVARVAWVIGYVRTDWYYRLFIGPLEVRHRRRITAEQTKES